MRNFIVYGICIFSFSVNLPACDQGAPGNNIISSDTIKITAGNAMYNQYCSGCHNFKQKGIGPQLSGVTKSVSVEWLQNFIRNPQRIINAHDKHADSLYQLYKTMMPSFASLSDDDMNNIIAFLNTHTEQTLIDTAEGVKDPVPDKIKRSGLTADIEPVTQIPASGDINNMPLARITKLTYQPGTNDLFINDLRGKLYKLVNNKPVVYMDIAKLKTNFIDAPGLATGFGSFAFHPQFEKNGLFYTAHTEKPGSAKADFNYPDSVPVTLQWVLTEWKADDPNANAFKGTGRELLRINMVSGIHGVQEICFNPHVKPGDEDYGLLYIGIGDGGCVENGFSFLAHNKQKVWGTILRIDPQDNNSANSKYGIPLQNPFINNKDAIGEIYAYGFRNPHRITWTKSGAMLVCNIGHGNIESIDLIKKGKDYGWPLREGTFEVHPEGDLNKVYLLPAHDTADGITYPIAEYDHDEGKAICGGFEYAGNAIPELKGKFLFGDIPTGRLFYIEIKDIRQGSEAQIKEWNISFNHSVQKLSELCNHERVDLHFGKDADGELYILTKADGKVYKLVSAEIK